MKTFSSIYFILLLVSCNTSEKKNTEISSEVIGTTEASKTEEKETPKEGITLKQNGDYSTLFSLQKGDCSFISASDIANALGLSESNIKDVSKNEICSYDITLNDNSNWSLSLQWHSMPRNEIANELKNYTNESSPLIALISKTEDTYLCIHPFNRFLMLYNTHYDGAIQVSYSPVLEYRKLTKEQIESRKEFAITLGDYLLQKHKK